MVSKQDEPEKSAQQQQPNATADARGNPTTKTAARTANQASDPSPQTTGAKIHSGESANSNSSASKVGNGPQSTKIDAVAMLKADHRQAEKFFDEFENADDDRKAQIVRQVCTALTLHTRLEEEIFYPACRDKASDEDPLDEAQVEHDSAKMLIADLMRGDEGDQYRDAKVKVLAEQVRHHVAEEEQARTGIFAKAQEAGVDMAELGQRIRQRKQELQDEDDLPAGTPVSFQAAGGGNRSAKENDMATNQTRDRDDRGRFRSDDDYDDRGSRRDNRNRDDDGRFISSRGGRVDDDDDRGGRSGGRGNGGGRGGSDDGRGWFGDAEGHSEAARRGWDDRGSSSRSSRSSRDDDDDDRGRRGNGRGGWFGDAEGHAEAGRRGWDDRGFSSRSSRSSHDDDDDRGRGGGRGDGRGWFGDPEGHSEASRRGWDDRGSSSRGRDDDDNRSRSRSGRDDDDDRSRLRSGRGYDDDRGGRGGWFGDPEGHSEASRRGWDDRGSSSRSSRRGRDDNDDRGDRSSRSSGGRSSRDDDDDGRGWHGDSRGHAEAARRGWENRR